MRWKGWAMLFLFGAALGAGLGDLIAEAHGTGTGVRAHPQSAPSQLAKANIPAGYLKLYQKTGKQYRIPWTLLAAIGEVETHHGQMNLPGVRSGLNRYKDKHGRWRSCCAGPMQFNVTDGPPSTWATYGKGDIYDPKDAVPAAARKLVANGARRNVDKAIYSYNHSWAYVANVKAWMARYRTGRTA